jgi:hypothetical protein
MLDEVLRNPTLRRALAAGEEQVGRVVGKLLARPSLSAGVSTLVSGALQARRTALAGLRQAMSAARLPSQDDVEGIRQRLDELEAMIDRMAERVRDPGPTDRDGPGRAS